MVKHFYRFGVVVLLTLQLCGCADNGVSVSGDGSQVAVSDNGNLWVADIEHENWRKIPLDGQAARNPFWSPEGDHVLFELINNAKSETATDSDKGRAATILGSACTALYNTKNGRIVRMSTTVSSPFAWSPDGSSFAAIKRVQGLTHIVWLNLDGVELRSLLLPDDIELSSDSGLDWLPVTNDIAFIALTGPKDHRTAHAFRTERDSIKQLSKAGEVAGLGYDHELNQLLWARVYSDQQVSRMAIMSFDPLTNAVNRRPFPEGLAFVPPNTMLMKQAKSLSGSDKGAPSLELRGRGSITSIGKVIFTSNGHRMAVIVNTVSHSGRKDDPVKLIEACYSVEADGSAFRRIRQTEGIGEQLHPVWSKDGRRLVILETGKDKPKLFVYNFDGTGKKMSPFPTE